MSTIRTLIVDDHPVFRDGVSSVLNNEADVAVVGEASDGQQALDLFRMLLPDVTLMDLRMPGMSGVDAIRAIHGEFPHARFIVLSTYSGDIQVIRAMEAGASGYLLKSALRNSLLNTIRAVHSGKCVVAPEAAVEVAEHLSSIPLTEKEVGILHYVADGLSNKAIANQLGLTEATIKSHMKSVLAKLHANDRTHAVMIASRRGYWIDSAIDGVFGSKV